MNDEWSQVAANAICHWAEMVGHNIGQAVAEHMRPSVCFRPALSIDGSQWCALYGENLQDGVAGFGDSPSDAMLEFDANWHKKLSNGGDRYK